MRRRAPAFKDVDAYSSVSDPLLWRLKRHGLFGDRGLLAGAAAVVLITLVALQGTMTVTSLLARVALFLLVVSRLYIAAGGAIPWNRKSVEGNMSWRMWSDIRWCVESAVRVAVDYPFVALFALEVAAFAGSLFVRQS
jgi:hypothetical protein